MNNKIKMLYLNFCKYNKNLNFMDMWKIKMLSFLQNMNQNIKNNTMEQSPFMISNLMANFKKWMCAIGRKNNSLNLIANKKTKRIKKTINFNKIVYQLMIAV